MFARVRLATAVLLSLPFAAGAQVPVSRPDSTPLALPCWDCGRPRQLGAALLEAQVGLWAAWSVNKFVRDNGISETYPAYWWNNTRGRWVWDDNTFGINQMGHPLQGAMYFNGFRTNGYGFWTSSASALAGSFLWECCFERHEPAPNDLITTWMGGVSLGELTRRLSDLVLDNRARGLERVGRELGAAALNPVRGLDRVVQGHAWRRGANDPTARPSRIQRIFAASHTQFDARTGGDPQRLSGTKLSGRWIYGDPWADVAKAPFSTFELQAELSSLPDAPINMIRTRGSLWGRRLQGGDTTGTRLTSYLQYDFARNPSFELGMQSVSFGWAAKRAFPRRRSLQADVSLRAVPIAAVADDSIGSIGEGRDYDFTYGGGVGVDLLSIAEGRLVGRIGSSLLALRNATGGANGAATAHVIGRYEAVAVVRVAGPVGVLLGARHFTRRSFFAGREGEQSRTSQLWVGLSAGVPAWQAY